MSEPDDTLDTLVYCPMCGSNEDCQFEREWEASTRNKDGSVTHTEMEERVCGKCKFRFWIGA